MLRDLQKQVLLREPFPPVMCYHLGMQAKQRAQGGLKGFSA